MRKNRILIWSIIVVLLCANIIYAEDGNSLDVVKTSIQKMENDNSLEALADSLGNALDKLNNAKKTFSNNTSLISSEYQANVSQRALTVKENAIRLEACQEYINILKAKYEVEIQKIVFSQGEEAYKDTQLRFKLGIASIDELETSEDHYIIQEIQLRIKERELEALITTLNAAMGQEPRTSYSTFTDNNMIPTEEIGTLEQYIDSAMNNRADILNSKEQLSVKEAEKKFAVYSHPKSDDPYYVQIDYEIENLKSEIETNTLDIQIEIQTKYDELTNSMKVLKDAQNAMSEASENLKLIGLKSDMGLITETDKRAGELDYIKAKYDFKNAQIDAWLIQEQMNCASGVGY